MLAAAKLETCSERQSFFDCEVGEDNIVLHDITRIIAEQLSIQIVLLVEGDLTVDAHAVFQHDSVGEQVEEGSFAGARRAHNEGRLAGQAVAGHVFEDVQTLCLRLARFLLFL